MSEPIPRLRLRGVRKQFGDKLVLDGIDLDVMPRTSLVVIGGSGSGKSVLLKCILGLIEPDAGSIEIDGRDLLTMPRAEREAARAQIGMLFQNGALFDSLPVWENVAFGLLARHKVSRAEAPNAPLRSWRSSGWRRAWGSWRRRNFRAGCKNAWRWPARSPRNRISCFLTSRRPGSIRSWARSSTG